MIGPVKINSDTHFLQATTAGTARVKVPAMKSSPFVFVYNSSDTIPIFANTGDVTVTAAFPTAGLPKGGKVIPPGQMQVFHVESGQEYIALGSLSSTANVYISTGAGT